MEITRKTPSLRQFKAAVRHFYSGNPYFKDNKSALIDLVCAPKGAFYARSRQRLSAYYREGELLCQCAFIQHSEYAGTLQIAFFEALPPERPGVQEALRQLIADAKALAEEWGAGTLTASLDGHCNYSLGFLSSGFDLCPDFGQSFNPPFYGEIFSGLGFSPVKLVSFREDPHNIDLRRLRLGTRLMARSNITLSVEDGKLSHSRFRGTMRRYTDLCNSIFSGHRYCFRRDYQEDYELFTPMRLLLDDENLIIAQRDGQDVGFLLWYFDFNMLIKPGGKLGLPALLRLRTGNKPTRLKIVQMAILPEYENTGLIALMLEELLTRVLRKYPQVDCAVSAWILDENARSKNLVSSFLKHPYKEQTVYEYLI